MREKKFPRDKAFIKKEVKPEKLNIEQEALVEDLYGRLNKLVNSGFALDKIVEILEAQDFFETSSKKGGETRVFHAKSWVADQVLKGVDLSLPDLVITSDETILPPGKDEFIFGERGAGFEPKGEIPRMKYLMELLGDLEIRYYLVEGKNAPSMMRKKSYYIFIVPEKLKLIFVNNEEGNATFIINGVSNSEEWRSFSKKTKDELKKLEAEGKVVIIIWPGNTEQWKALVSQAILENTVQGITTSEEIEISIPQHELQEKAEELKKAYAKWMHEKDVNSSKFTDRWLQANGFGNLYTWLAKNSCVSTILKLAGDDISNSFSTRLKEYTTAEAIYKMQSAHEKWKLENEKRGQGFGEPWLKMRFPGLVSWCKSHGGLPLLLGKMGLEIQEGANKKSENQKIVELKSKQRAIEKLKEAHQKWKETNGGTFNINWLVKNGYWGLYRWTLRKTRVEDLVDIIGGEVKENFKKN